MSESNPVIERLKDRFGHDIKDTTAFGDDPVVTVPKDRICEVIEFLKSHPELAFTMLLDLCGVDYPEREERFELVYNLRSLKLGHHLRLRVRLSGPEPRIPTITHLFQAANWFEREAYDMYGIDFSGHPNLKRLLTHEEFVGHPLRKDYVSTQRHRCTRTTELD